MKFNNPWTIEISNHQRTHVFQRNFVISSASKEDFLRVWDKNTCNQYLMERGFSFSKSLETNFLSIEELSKNLNFPIVLKPSKGHASMHVYCNIKSPSELKDILSSQKTRDVLEQVQGNFLLEEYIEGVVYRTLVCVDKVLATIIFKPGFLKGDGKSSILELLEKKMGRDLVQFHLTSIEWHINKRGFELDDLLEKGKKLRISDVPTPSHGGDIHFPDVAVPETVKDKLVSLLACLNIKIAQIEFVVPKQNENLNFNDLKFIDINGGGDIMCFYGLKEIDFSKDIVGGIIETLMESTKAEPVKKIGFNPFLDAQRKQKEG